ncbi:hypothetical protein ACOSQ4_028245 [Xanthoceras sorbifolium]
MGRHPGEILSSSSSSSSTNQNLTLSNVLDRRLAPPTNQSVVQDIIRAVAFACLRLEPKSRPTMEDVSQTFLARKTPISSTSCHRISIAELKQQDICFNDV